MVYIAEKTLLDDLHIKGVCFAESDRKTKWMCMKSFFKKFTLEPSNILHFDSLFGKWIISLILLFASPF